MSLEGINLSVTNFLLLDDDELQAITDLKLPLLIYLVLFDDDKGLTELLSIPVVLYIGGEPTLSYVQVSIFALISNV